MRTRVIFLNKSIKTVKVLLEKRAREPKKDLIYFGAGARCLLCRIRRRVCGSYKKGKLSIA